MAEYDVRIDDQTKSMLLATIAEKLNALLTEQEELVNRTEAVRVELKTLFQAREQIQRAPQRNEDFGACEEDNQIHDEAVPIPARRKG